MRLTAAASKVLASYGAVEPRARPEEWTAVRREVDTLMAEDFSGEDSL